MQKYRESIGILGHRRIAQPHLCIHTASPHIRRAERIRASIASIHEILLCVKRASLEGRREPFQGSLTIRYVVVSLLDLQPITIEKSLLVDPNPCSVSSDPSAHCELQRIFRANPLMVHPATSITHTPSTFARITPCLHFYLRVTQ